MSSRHADSGTAAAALARYYDLDLRDDPGDVEMYEALARRTGGPVLELGVGSGRIAVPLAEAGFAVTGVDDDAAMLARAEAAWHEASPAGVTGTPRLTGTAHAAGSTDTPRGRATNRATATTTGSLTLLNADLTTLRLDARFGLAFLALNTLMLLADAEQQVAALRTLAAHLRPDGLAVVDVWLPGPDDLALYDGRLLLEWLRFDAETGDQVSKLASAQFDSATATVTLTQFFDAWASGGGPIERVARTDRLRLVGAFELVRMAADAGLAVELLAGDHQMSPFGPGVDRAILLGRLV